MLCASIKGILYSFSQNRFNDLKISDSRGYANNHLDIVHIQQQRSLYSIKHTARTDCSGHSKQLSRCDLQLIQTKGEETTDMIPKFDARCLNIQGTKTTKGVRAKLRGPAHG